jgi:hypothetical protein
MSLALALAVLVTPAFAQDSTSTTTSIGDAIWTWSGEPTEPVYTTREVVNNFVVDLEPIQSSWGNDYLIAPLIKSGKTSFTFLSSLISAQAMSKVHILDVPYPYTSYGLWNVQQEGINDIYNLPPSSTATPTGLSNQFGVALSEFSTSDAGASVNSIISGIVNYDPANPERLYVTRYQAAGNGQNNTENRAQIGFGSVDATGNVHFRADDFGVTGPTSVTGNNVYRVDSAMRNPALLNWIDFFGGNDAAATTPVQQGYFDVLTCPTIIPEEVNGRPVLLSATFNWTYAYEQVPASLTIDPSHRAPGTTTHRGNVNFTPVLTCQPGSVGTAGMLAYNAAGPQVLNLWDVDANGVVLGAYALTSPTAYALPGGATFGGPPSGCDFDHYHGQTAFRGNAPVAIGVDQLGRGLAAATLYDNNLGGSYLNNYNAIGVARFDCGGHANAQWALAGYVAQDPTGADIGSPIFDGSGNIIGELAPYTCIVGAGNTAVSMSGPAFDSVGNVYFLSSFLRYSSGDCNSGLFRAVYDPSAQFATGLAYQLELLIEFGQEFRGQNSNTDYQIQYLAFNASGSVDSGTLWAANATQAAFAGINPAGLPTDDPRTLGGLVFQAGIVYDINDDGQYDDTVGGPDEAYNVLMYISGQGTTAVTEACCFGDGSCLDEDPVDCRLNGGVPYGVGSSCATTTCPAWCMGDSSCSTGSPTFEDITYFVAALAGNASWADYHVTQTGNPPLCPYLINDMNGYLPGGTPGVEFSDIPEFVSAIGQTCVPYQY